jgi:hypothetical protein
MNLFIATTVDVDNDGVSLNDERNRLTWQSLELVPTIARIVHARGLPATWFVRADPQLREVCGQTSYLIEHHRSLWAQLKEEGDEIGWHPHLYSMSGGESVYRPVYDDSWAVRELRTTLAELRALGHQFYSVRMGEAIGSNAIVHTLSELGLVVDSSAIPGRRRRDKSRTFDWSTSPNTPYWPSKADYRVPGSPALPILEIPMTAVVIRAPYDSVPLVRYINLAYRPEIFADAIDRWFDSNAEFVSEAVLTLILHPDELMPRRQSHPLYESAPATLSKNLDAVFEAARRREFNVIGHTTSNLMKHFAGPIPN